MSVTGVFQLFFFSSRRRHTRLVSDWSSDVCSSDLGAINGVLPLVRLRSRMFGDFLVSVPYVNYGGCCADTEDIEQDLLRASVRVAGELGDRKSVVEGKRGDSGVCGVL